MSSRRKWECVRCVLELNSQGCSRWVRSPSNLAYGPWLWPSRAVHPCFTKPTSKLLLKSFLMKTHQITYLQGRNRDADVDNRHVDTRRKRQMGWIWRVALAYTHCVCMLSHSVVSNYLCGLPGSSVHGILQARMLEWLAMPFSRGSSQPRDRTRSLLSPALAVQLFPSDTTWEAPYIHHHM